MGGDVKALGQELERLRIGLEDSVRERASDFSALYVSVCDLHSFCVSHCGHVREDTVSVLRGVMEGREHEKQKLALFLYKEAANALASISVSDEAERDVAEQAAISLREAVINAGGNSRRAAAEAMGSLPTRIHGIDPVCESPAAIPSITWKDLLDHCRVKSCMSPSMIGRSLLVPAGKDPEIVAVKLACADDPMESLQREAAWMDLLRSKSASFGAPFHVPKPLTIDGSYVFRLDDRPVNGYGGRCLHPEGYAIGFATLKDYFTYINDHRAEVRPGPTRFRDALFTNARLLGSLASSGVVHTAPIPLFHNRVQRNRRADNGLYEWQRGGRLDRWLDSCRYPNFGLTGIRDFEHFTCLCSTGGSKLYEQIGMHMLSLLLVTGSYFRNKDGGRVGVDAEGRPVDARDLFEKPFLVELIGGIFKNYYRGFVGAEYVGEKPFDLDALASRMVEEMGVDRHMEEILRAADQKAMRDEEFRHFLLDRGFSDGQIASLERGSEDITIHTGPHLGGFNQRISLPELIDFIATASALCVAGRYIRERWQQAEADDEYFQDA